MRAILPILLAAMALGACEKQPELDSKEATAIVKRVNYGSRPIQPQPILEQELGKLQFRSAGCVFSPGNGGHGAMALAMQEAGYMKFDDKIVRFAADNGSAMLPEGIRARYFGTTHLFHLTFAEPGRGHLNVRDHAGTVVFEADGKVWCDTEAGPPASPASGSA